MNRTHITLLITVLLSLIAGYHLLRPGFFSIHDDLQVMRQHQMHRCFQDGQIPCRWVPDLGAGYGAPLYNFYSPLPSYVGMIFVWFGSSYLDTTKALLLLGLIASGIGMHAFIYRLTNSPYAALTAAVLYLWAPYHANDIYVRGALAESWGLAWFPWILLTIWNWSRRPQAQIDARISISIAGLLLSHNIMSVWFAPIIVLWSIYCIILNKKYQLSSLIKLALSGLWAAGLAAFFFLPAAMEKDLVHSDTLTSDYYNFRAHYATLHQLFFDRSWGYGASLWGPVDDMSFQIGWPHWWLLALALPAGLHQLRHKNYKYLSLLAFFISLFFIATFMTHSRSIYLWEAVPILAFTQFPWRVLALTIFINSIVVGICLKYFSSTIQKYLTFAICILAIIMNWQYFQVDAYDPNHTDQTKLYGAQWDIQRRAALLDYLPKTTQTYDVFIAEQPVTITGPGAQQARYENFIYRSDTFSLDIFSDSNQPIQVQVGVFDFPTWQVYDADQLLEITHDNEYGLITFTIDKPGKHIITGWFTDTPVRKYSNLITLVSYLLFVVYLVQDRSTSKPN